MTARTIIELQRARCGLAMRLALAEAEAHRLRADLAAIDAALGPDLAPVAPLPAPVPPRLRASRGEGARLYLELLRCAGEPLTASRIALAAMAARGLDGDAATVRLIRRRTKRALDKLATKGRIERAGLDGTAVRYGLTGAGGCG